MEGGSSSVGSINAFLVVSSVAPPSRNASDVVLNRIPSAFTVLICLFRIKALRAAAAFFLSSSASFASSISLLTTVSAYISLYTPSLPISTPPNTFSSSAASIPSSYISICSPNSSSSASSASGSISSAWFAGLFFLSNNCSRFSLSFSSSLVTSFSSLTISLSAFAFRSAARLLFIASADSVFEPPPEPSPSPKFRLGKEPLSASTCFGNVSAFSFLGNNLDLSLMAFVFVISVSVSNKVSPSPIAEFASRSENCSHILFGLALALTPVLAVPPAESPEREV